MISNQKVGENIPPCLYFTLFVGDTLYLTPSPPLTSPCLVYIDMGLDNNNPIVLTVVTSGASFERSFNIKVTQIECDSLSKGIIISTFTDN